MISDFTADAIVLAATEVGEEDRILTFLTRDLGLLRAAASSVSNLKKGRSAALDLFVRTRISFTIPRRSGSLKRIRSAEVLDAFMGIRKDYERLCAASYMGQTIIHCIQEEEEARGVFDVVNACLNYLNSGMERYRVLLLFETRILRELGMFPELERCMFCGEQADRTCRLEPGEGGVVHMECGGQDHGKVLTPGDLSVLRYLSNRSIEAASRLTLPDKEAKRLFSTVHDFAVHHLEYEAKAYKTLEPVED